MSERGGWVDKGRTELSPASDLCPVATPVHPFVCNHQSALPAPIQPRQMWTPQYRPRTTSTCSKRVMGERAVRFFNSIVTRENQARKEPALSVGRGPGTEAGHIASSEESPEPDERFCRWIAAYRDRRSRLNTFEHQYTGRKPTRRYTMVLSWVEGTASK